MLFPVTREANFAAWYQQAVAEADMAEESGVGGCMIIRPWGYAIQSWRDLPVMINQWSNIVRSETRVTLPYKSDGDRIANAGPKLA